MKVILLQKVKGLGGVDEIKEVADGYARNFLFPNNLAVPASKGAIDQLELKNKKKAKDEERDLKSAQKLAAQLDGLEVELTEKVSEAGQLYAAVSKEKIVNKLKEIGFDVAKANLNLKPIKEPGDHQVEVNLGHGLEASLTVIVNQEES